MFGYSGHVSIFTIWQTSWDTVFSSLFVTEATQYSLSCYVLWGQASFCTNGHAQLCWLWSVNQSGMLNVYHCLSHLFLFTFPCNIVPSSETVSVAAVSSPLVSSLSWCSYPYWCCMQSLGLFPGFSVNISCNGTWSASVCKVHIVIKTSRLLHPCSIKLHLSYLVRWFLDILIIVMIRFIYVIQVVQPLSFQTSLPSFKSNQQAWYYSDSNLNTYPSQCGRQQYIMRKVGSRMAPSSSHCSGSFSTLRLTRGGSVGILTYQSISALLHLEKSTTSGCLQVECCQPPLIYHVSYAFSPALVSLVLSRFLPEHVTGQFRLLILVATCWMGASWFSTVFGMLKDIHGCFARLGAQESAYPNCCI